MLHVTVVAQAVLIICCGWLHCGSLCTDTLCIPFTPWELKAAQMNLLHSQTMEFILYKFKVGHNVVKATENICYAKDEDAVDHSK